MHRLDYAGRPGRAVLPTALVLRAVASLAWRVGRVGPHGPQWAVGRGVGQVVQGAGPAPRICAGTGRKPGTDMDMCGCVVWIRLNPTDPGGLGVPWSRQAGGR